MIDQELAIQMLIKDLRRFGGEIGRGMADHMEIELAVLREEDRMQRELHEQCLEKLA